MWIGIYAAVALSMGWLTADCENRRLRWFFIVGWPIVVPVVLLGVLVLIVFHVFGVDHAREF